MTIKKVILMAISGLTMLSTSTWAFAVAHNQNTSVKSTSVRFQKSKTMSKYNYFNVAVDLRPNGGSSYSADNQAIPVKMFAKYTQYLAGTINPIIAVGVVDEWKKPPVLTFSFYKKNKAKNALKCPIDIGKLNAGSNLIKLPCAN